MSKRILVIEHDNELRLGLVRSLNDEGYCNVISTNSLERGVKLSSGVDLVSTVLTERGSKDVGGSHIKYIMEANPNVRVIILTDHDSWNDKVAGFEAGAHDYLTKPFQTDEWLARIKALLKMEPK